MEIFRLFGTIFVKNEADKELDKVKKKSNDVSKGMKVDFKKIGQASNQVGNSLLKYVTAPIKLIGASAVKLGMEFEASMSNVKALSGSTGEEMKVLEQKAREMGASTSKSAKDAADAMGYMALAGWDNKQMLAGIEPILRLSEAGNLDLARASDLVTDSMSAMGITTKQLPHYLDVLAQTSRSSNTDIDMLGEAYIKVGGNLAGLKVPLEESATLLGTMANRGRKGAEAGNALNAIITNLTAPAGQAKDAMKGLGLSAFDSNGKFKGLTNTLLELKTKTSKLSEEQRQQYLSMIGGKEHIKDLNALLNGLGDEYGTLSGKVNNADGSLMDLAKTMQDNNKGSLTELMSSVQELGLKIADVLRPKISQIIDLLKKWSDKLNKLTPEQQKTIIKIAQFAASIGIALKAIGLIISIADKVKTAWAFLAANPWVAVIAGVIALATIIYMNWDKIVEYTTQVWNGIVDFVTTIWNDIKQTASDIWNSIVDGIKGMWNGFVEWVTQLWTDIKQGFVDGWNAIGDFFTQTIPTFFSNLTQWFVDGWNSLMDTINDFASKVGAFFNDLWNNWSYYLGYALGYVITSIAKWVVDVYDSMVTGISNTIDTVVEWFSTMPGKIWTWLVDAWNKTVTWVTNTYKTMKDGTIKAINAVVDWFKTLPGKVWNWLVNTINKVITWSTNLVTTMRDGAIKAINVTIDWFKKLPNKIWTWLVNTITKVTQFANDLKNKAIEAAKGFVDALWDGVKSLPDKFMNLGKMIVEGVWKGITGMFGWLTDKVKGFFNGIVDGAKAALDIHSPSRVFRDQIGQWIPKGVAVGIENNLGSITKAVDKMVGATIPTMAQASPYLNEFADEMARRVIGADDEINAKIEESNRVLNNKITEVESKNANKRNEIKRKSAEAILKLERETNKKIENIRYQGSKKKKRDVADENRRIEQLTRDSSYKISKIKEDESRKLRKIKDEEFKQLAPAYEKNAKELQKLEEEYNKKRLDAVNNFVSEKKKFNEVSLYDEMALYQEAQTYFMEGTESRKEIDLKYRDSKQAMYDYLSKLNSDYAKKIQDVNSKLEKNIDDLNKKYETALDNRKKSLVGFAGTFDEVKKVEIVSGQTLTKNLQDQVNLFATWADEIQRLANRGIDKGLLAELQGMGVKAAGEIHGLNQLTDKELNNYVNLWKTKNEMARIQATKELQDMRIETNQEIRKLQQESKREVDKLQDEWVKGIIELRTGTLKEFDVMTASMEQIGENLVKNVQQGLSNVAPALIKQVQTLGVMVKDSLVGALDIGNFSDDIMDIGASKFDISPTTQITTPLTRTNVQTTNPMINLADSLGDTLKELKKPVEITMDGRTLAQASVPYISEEMSLKRNRR